MWSVAYINDSPTRSTSVCIVAAIVAEYMRSRGDAAEGAGQLGPGHWQIWSTPLLRASRHRAKSSAVRRKSLAHLP
jgi:hypothetical protein